MDLNEIQAYLQANPAIAAGLGIGVVLIVIIFVFLRKKKQNKLEAQIAQECSITWGRDKIRELTIKDLDNLSRFFIKYKKKLIVGGMVSRIVVGNTIGYMNLKNKEIVKRDLQKDGTTKLTYGDKDIDMFLIRFSMPKWQSLSFPPFSWFFKIKKYLIIDKEDILNNEFLAENTTELRLKCNEFQELFGVYLPMNNDLTKITKLEEYPLRAFAEELTGRLSNVPCKTAQLHLQHTEELALTEKRSEVLANAMKGSNPNLKPM